MAGKAWPWLLGYSAMALWYLGVEAFPAAKDTCILVPGVSQTNCSGWVQAFGSIAGIVAGAAAIWWQAGKQRRDRAADQVAEEVRRLQLLWELVYTCRATMAHFARKSATGGQAGHPNAYRQSVAALRTVQILEAPDSEAARAVVVAIQAYDIYEDGLKSATAGNRQHEVPGLIDVAKGNLEFAEALLRQRLRLRGADIPQRSGSLQIAGVLYPALDPMEFQD